VGGAAPVATQVSSARNAALATRCIGPLSIGTPQSMVEEIGPSRCISAWEVPATSHSRNLELSG
jgi:hypothetical protein